MLFHHTGHNSAVSTVLDSANIQLFHHRRKFCETALNWRKNQIQAAASFCRAHKLRMILHFEMIEKQSKA